MVIGWGGATYKTKLCNNNAYRPMYNSKVSNPTYLLQVPKYSNHDLPTICTSATDTSTERLSFCFHQFPVLPLFYSLFLFFFHLHHGNVSYHMQKSVLHACLLGFKVIHQIGDDLISDRGDRL